MVLSCQLISRMCNLWKKLHVWI